MPVSHASLLQQARNLTRTGQVSLAIQAYRTLLTSFPTDAESWYNFAVLLRQTGNYPAALSAYDQALQNHVSSPEEVHLNKAVLLLDAFRDAERCEAELKTALEIRPDYIPALFNLGGLQEDLGKRDAAYATYQRLLELEPDNAEFLARRAGLENAKSTKDASVLELQERLEKTDLTSADRAILGFALGRQLDGCGAWDAAFNAYREANEQSRRHAPKYRYSSEAEKSRLESLQTAFPVTSSVTALEQVGFSEPTFILGMFRSGSTLVEQVLSGHPDIGSGGELDMLAHISRSLGRQPHHIANAPTDKVENARKHYQALINKIGQGRKIVTDKRPENFWEIGLIKRLFPKAKIIHTRRHPLDNCLSVYFQHLHPSLSYAMDLDACAEHLLIERQMMAHWKQLWPEDIMTVDYADMVLKPEETISGVLSFLGLPWNEACLRFYETPNIVRTASVWQVRQALHAKSLGRWKLYDAHLQAIRNRLHQSGVADEL